MTPDNFPSTGENESVLFKKVQDVQQKVEKASESFQQKAEPMVAKAVKKVEQVKETLAEKAEVATSALKSISDEWKQKGFKTPAAFERFKKKFS